MTKIIGVSRVRNVDFIIKDILDHLSSILDFVIIYDDASTDNTNKILQTHPLVREVIKNDQWITDRVERAKAEGKHRQLLYDKAKSYNPDWIYVFDADEFLELTVSPEKLDKSLDAYYFRLFDYYITPEDVNFTYKERKYIGPEYRDIPMLFNADVEFNFKARVPKGIKSKKLGGFVKHYGKAISVEEWQKKCHYYINNLEEKQPGGIDISNKWLSRLDKAIHTKSDFNRELITWEEKETFGFELSYNFEKVSTYKLNILVANHKLARVGGSETFTYTIIDELNKNPNYNVEYFCFHKGVVAQKIEDLGVGFMTKKKYDLILANHNTCVNKLYKKGFVIQTCHGIYPQLEQPSKKANAYVAISQEVQNHLAEKGFSSKLIYNSIDLTRFYPKNNISNNLKAVLSLCHSKEANTELKELCSQLDLEYLEAYKYESPIWDIANLINQSDIVFGLGRSAYEAIACGRPVIVWDKRGYFPSYADGYVKKNLGLSLINNCSGRYSKEILTIENLKEELKNYNQKDQNFFRGFALKHFDVRKNVVEYIEYALKLQEQKRNNKFPLNVILKIKYAGGFLPALKKAKKKLLKKFKI